MIILFTQDEEFCNIPVNIAAKLTSERAKAELNGAFPNQQTYTEVLFAVPVEFQEQNVTIVMMMTNCAGANYTDPLEVG